MKKFALILLALTLWSVNGFAQSDGPVPDVPERSDIRVTAQAENNDYITLVEPHVVVDGSVFRFSSNKNTYEGLCSLILNGADITDVDDEISSNGTVFLNSEGEVIRYSPIFQSLRFVRCLK